MNVKTITLRVIDARKAVKSYKKTIPKTFGQTDRLYTTEGKYKISWFDLFC